jgi:hypothetical protein
LKQRGAFFHILTQADRTSIDSNGVFEVWPPNLSEEIDHLPEKVQAIRDVLYRSITV